MTLRYRPNIDKIVELLLYLAYARPDADKYQAVKFFYLADREHLNRYGRPITQEMYFALWYGPVASKTLDLLEGDKWVMREAKIDSLPFDTEIRPAKNGKDTVFIGAPHREVNLEVFSKSDLKVFDEIIEKYKDYDFEQLYQETHSHEAYKNAWESRPRNAKRNVMKYEEMIESPELRERILDDMGPVSAQM